MKQYIWFRAALNLDLPIIRLTHSSDVKQKQMLFKEVLYHHKISGTPHCPIISATGQRLPNPLKQPRVHPEDRKERQVPQRPDSHRTARTHSGGALAGPRSTVIQF